MKRVKFNMLTQSMIPTSMTTKPSINMNTWKSNTLKVLQWRKFYRAAKKEMSFCLFDQNHIYLFKCHYNSVLYNGNLVSFAIVIKCPLQ